MITGPCTGKRGEKPRTSLTWMHGMQRRKDPAEVLAHKQAHDRKYRKANRKRISAQRKARYAEDAEYREQAIARAKKHYEANREKVIARSIARAKADPERAREYARRAYAEKRRAGCV